MVDLDEEWANFMATGGDNAMESTSTATKAEHSIQIEEESSPKESQVSGLYISTTTKISFLDRPISLATVFWQIPITPYCSPKEGVVKKQMKFSSTSQEELNEMLSKIDENDVVSHHIITRVVNPNGRVKFKDIRKVSIGLCKKDIISHRCREKGAFYNCFVVILRVLDNNVFKEIHVKVFNTGKLEIPGIQSSVVLHRILDLILSILSPLVGGDTPVKTIGSTETVLINSNFTCGYDVNREKLYSIVRNKYRLSCNFDPCSYPGVQCKYYYNEDTDDVSLGRRDGTEQSKISFMVFRTGSVLIVGKCVEETLYKVYERIRDMLINERQNVSEKTTYIPGEENQTTRVKDTKVGSNKKKIRRTICVPYS